VNRGFGERRFPSVVNDDRESVRLVLEHLASLGHRRVAHIAGPSSSSTGRARRQAFEELASGFGIEGAIVEARAFTREAGLEAALELLGRARDWTAIFAGNDLIAMGALDALRKHGLAVPGDVSVVGHNDMPLVDLIAPPLTTVRIAVDQMSRQAAQLLLEHLKSPHDDPSMRVLMPRLVVRSSTGSPRV
jgi:LacI family transcriptional regulator